MTTIDGSNITITKGDTLLVQIGVTKNGAPYVPQEGDVIRFALKERYTDAACKIEKEIPTDTLLLHVPASEMKTLEVGSYVYDIQLTDKDGIVDTFIAGKLKTKNEVE